MDRKGLIGLLLCGILFAAHFHYSIQNAKAKHAEELRRKREAMAHIEKKDPSTAAETTAGVLEVEQVEEVEEAPEQLVRMETDSAIFTFTTKGGGVKTAAFKDQLAVKSKNELVKLNRFGDVPVGELVKGSVDAHLGLDYKIARQEKGLIEFGAETADGLRILKTWHLSTGEREVDAFLLDLEITLQNGQGEQVLDLAQYGLHAGSAAATYEDEHQRFTTYFYYAGSLKSKAAGKTFAHEVANATYAGVSNQFFTTMLSTKEPVSSFIRSRTSEVTLDKASGGGRKPVVRLAWGLPAGSLKPGETRKLSYEIFMGPKDNGIVSELDQGRGDIMDYGWFGWVSRPLNWLLHLYHDNIFVKFAKEWAWGLAIILLTLTIRLFMWPLHNASAKTMKRMSKLQPLMQGIKEKHPDDPQKQQMEMAKLYKDYHINPVGGCLPMFAQFPIFLGFFSMLQHAVEFRGQKFLWVPDLSLPDTLVDIPLPFSLPALGDHLPINLLPILMVATMFIQMQMTPKTGDPMQRRIFMLMPFIFFFFCYNYASALALYWTTQNIFSIGQTWWMQKQPDVELQKKAPGKKSLFDKLQEKAEEAQRLQQQKRKGGNPSPDPNAKPKKPRGPRTGG